MALILTDVGAAALLDTYLNDSRPAGGNDVTLRLFVNDITPTQTETGYTEAAGGGYNNIVLTNGSWTVSDSSDPSSATYAERVFAFTGPLDTNTTIYGYYVTDGDDTIIYAERLNDPFTPTSASDILRITPKIEASSGVTS